ncbi:hypothetical protein [Nocardioides sp. MH1]|uniref:hypothetical protein n=1 Tax=Nocardioides sp. MH1 TaxID=3242490 RepID=UPI00352165BE
MVKSSVRARIAGTIALAAASALLPAAPASGTPVDGEVSAGAYALGGGACEVQTASDGKVTSTFQPGDGGRTATSTADFLARDGGDRESVHGHSETSSTGVAVARDGALGKVTFTAQQQVTMTDDRASDCGLRIVDDTQAEALVRVRRRGRLRIAWESGGAGVIEQILVSRNGTLKFNDFLPGEQGTASIRVGRGRFRIYTHFSTRVGEDEVATHDTVTRKGDYSTVVTFRR